MKWTLCVLLFILAAVLPCAAQSMGTVTENGVAMEVKSAVAFFDAQKPSLRIMLFPDKVPAEDIAKIQSNDMFWNNGKTSPDVKKWKDWYPYAHFELGWGFEKEALGDPKKASVYIYSNGIGSQGSNMNVNKFGDSTDVTLAGPIKVGQEVKLTSKGSDTIGDSTFSWDLKVNARVHAAQKQK